MGSQSSHFAVTRTALVREAVMCRFFRLAGLTDASGLTRSERRTFIPLSIGIQALSVPLSLGTSGDLHSITGDSGEKGISVLVERVLHTHVWGCGGWLLDVE